MTTISQGQHAYIFPEPGQVYRVQATGVATVQVIYGAPSAVITLDGNSQTFGPYDAPAKLRISANTAAADYTLIRAHYAELTQAQLEGGAAGVLASNNAGGAIEPDGDVPSLGANADALADLLEAAPTADPASLARIKYSVSEDGGVVYASRWGIADDPTLTVDQAGRINQMIADLRGQNFGGEIVFPDGDVCYTGPIDWSGVGENGRFYYVSSNMYIKPPKLSSRNGVRLRMLNPATQNCLGMLWEITAAQVAAGIKRIFYPRFQNIEWHGPGCTLKTSGLSADVAAGAVDLPLTVAAEVGDAVLLSAGKESHWATVRAVNGLTATIDSKQPLLVAWTAAATNVTVWKQTRILQFGGTSSTGSMVTQQVIFDDCQFHSAFQGAFFDDTTGIDFVRPQIKGVVHAICAGYNFDVVNIYSPYIGSDRPPLTAATCTNGSNVVVAGGAGGVKPGEKLWEAPGADGSLGFPEHTYIVSVSGSSITVSNNYVGTTGSKTLYPGCGILVVAGNGATAAVGGHGALTNYSNIFIYNLLSGRIDRLFDIADTVGNGVSIRGAYVESSQRIGVGGRRGAVGSFGPVVLENIWCQNADVMTGAGCEDFLGAGGKWDIHVFASGSAKYPLFQSRSTSNLRVGLRQGWAWSNVSTASRGNSGISAAPTIIFGTIDEQCYVFSGRAFEFGNVDYRRLSAAMITKSHSGALNFNWPGHNGVDITMTGNIGSGAIVNGVPPKGYYMLMIFTQGGVGGYTVTLPSYWVNSDGAAIGTIAGGAVGTVCMMGFVSTGTKLLRVDGAPAFV